MISLVAFTFVDCAILFTGKPYIFHTVDRPYYLLAASIATFFSALTVFIWRSGWPRILIALFGFSMASHVALQFVSLRPHPLEFVASCRVLIAISVISLVFRYRSADVKP